MTETKCPRRTADPVAGGNTGRPYPTRSVADGNSSLEDLGVVFASETLEAERSFLTAAWLDPVEGNDAAFAAGLNGSYFALPENSYLFCYVCLNAETGRNPTVDEAVRLASQCSDVALDDGDLFDILIPPLSTIEVDRLDEYVRRVIDFSRRRELSRELYRKSVELYAGDDVEVVVRPRERRASAKLLRRAPAQHRATKRKVICCE